MCIYIYDTYVYTVFLLYYIYIYICYITYIYIYIFIVESWYIQLCPPIEANFQSFAVLFTVPSINRSHEIPILLVFFVWHGCRNPLKSQRHPKSHPEHLGAVSYRSTSPRAQVVPTATLRTRCRRKLQRSHWSWRRWYQIASSTLDAGSCWDFVWWCLEDMWRISYPINAHSSEKYVGLACLETMCVSV